MNAISPFRRQRATHLQTDKIGGRTTRRHTSVDFIEFLAEIVTKTRWAKQIHIVLDNLSAYNTRDAVQESLAANPKVHFHFTPTYTSSYGLLNIQRDVINRRIFTSVPDLSRKTFRLMPNQLKRSAGPTLIPSAASLSCYD